jgi:hypothetical protein
MPRAVGIAGIAELLSGQAEKTLPWALAQGCWDAGNLAHLSGLAGKTWRALARWCGRGEPGLSFWPG